MLSRAANDRLEAELRQSLKFFEDSLEICADNVSRGGPALESALRSAMPPFRVEAQLR
jgi:hypothetical protein